MKIACLEEDAKQAEFVRHIVMNEGHECHLFGDGRALIHELWRERYDMLLVDWQLSGVTGYEVTAWVRAHVNERVPIVFLTNRALEEDIVAGLMVGADDYMIKPIRRAEFTARMTALFRRTAPIAMEAGESITVGDYRVDAIARVFYLREELIELTCREYDLAFLLFQHVGRVVSRERIHGKIWRQGPNWCSRTVDTHMSRVRAKLRLRAENGLRLTPVYGHGYRLDVVDSKRLAPGDLRVQAMFAVFNEPHQCEN